VRHRCTLAPGASGGGRNRSWRRQHRRGERRTEMGSHEWCEWEQKREKRWVRNPIETITAKASRDGPRWNRSDDTKLSDRSDKGHPSTFSHLGKPN
jgi:hypothetical protein